MGKRWTPKRIRELREALGVSQTKFGEMLGLSMRMIQYLDSGEHKASRVQQLALNYIELTGGENA